VVPGQCAGPVPASACVAGNRGVRSLRPRPKGLVPSEGYRLGKTGRVDANESSMMPRQANSRRWVAPAGGRDWPQESGRRRLDRARRSGAHRRPRGSEDTQPGRISLMRNTTTPMRSGRPVRLVADRKEGQSSVGAGRPNKRMPAAERKQETGCCMADLHRRYSHNWPDRGRCSDPKGR